MLSLDTETTGVDFYHGARPFFVTVCHEDGRQLWWEWDVDPTTRRPEAPPDDIGAIRHVLLRELNGGGKIIFQNAKFDLAALYTLGIDWPEKGWECTHDTLLAGHLLASNQPHDLTSMVLYYLGEDLQPLEDRLEKECKEARRLVQQAKLRAKRTEEEEPSLFGSEVARGDGPLARYRIANGEERDMPSAGYKSWKYDGWLPRALAEELGYPRDHPWYTVLRDYSNADSEHTVALWMVLEVELHRRGLWKIYQESRKLPPLLLGMERRGVTYNQRTAAALKERFAGESAASKRKCLEIAWSFGYDLQLPEGAAPNGSVRTFCFDVLRLPPHYSTKAKSSAPSLDKVALDTYEKTLEGGPALEFIKALRHGRRRDTYQTYLESYARFGLPSRDSGNGWLTLHPSINQTGTDTLRPSSSHPNGQNVGKQDVESSEGESVSLRTPFGPAPGREWWGMDYDNIELRIPAYASRQEEMIQLFERPDEPPFFGSWHLLNGSIIYPDLFWPLAEQRGAFKERYGATWYQWLKNFDFAVQYSAGRETADKAAHKNGAFDAVQTSLGRVTELKRRVMAFAEKYGYVETIPDKTVDPARGYPLLCTRSEYGRIVPTVPFSYYVQGTAMWASRKALRRCGEQLGEWNRVGKAKYYVIFWVHDELIFDFPKGGKTNLPKVRKLQRLMEQSGDDIGIPLKVSVSYHPNNWNEKVKL